MYVFSWTRVNLCRNSDAVHINQKEYNTFAAVNQTFVHMGVYLFVFVFPRLVLFHISSMNAATTCFRYFNKRQNTLNRL